MDLFRLPTLNYTYESLAPTISARTMEIHYSKHHAGYVHNLNKEFEQGTESSKKSIEEIIQDIGKYSQAVRNNGGGHYNHTLFWESLKPKGSPIPKGLFHQALEANFNSTDQCIQHLQQAALSLFGSGWAWLVLIPEKGELKIATTPNQDNPYMHSGEEKQIPLLGIDVWEHAYYLDYQNQRAQYLKEIFQIIDWELIAHRYDTNR